VREWRKISARVRDEKPRHLSKSDKYEGESRTPKNQILKKNHEARIPAKGLAGNKWGRM